MRKVDIEQGSFEWHCLRQGKVTGTTLKSALGTPKVQHTLACRLVAERMTEPKIDDINVESISHGRELEPIGRKAVIEETGLQFSETGMLLSDELEHFGFSPDGIYEENGVVVGGLEIKCPNSKKHVEYLLEGGVPKEYIDQVKSPFVLSDEVQWWIFASFDDRSYERPLFIHKAVRADFPEIEADREKLAKFLDLVNEHHETLTF